MISVFHFHIPVVLEEPFGCVLPRMFARASTLLVRFTEGDLFWLLPSIPRQRRHALQAPSHCEWWREEAKLGETVARRQCEGTGGRGSDLTNAAVEDLGSEVLSPSAL